MGSEMCIRDSGKAVSRAVRARVAQKTLALKEQGVTPGLAVILVGEDPASQVYVRNKEKACDEVGFYSEKYTLPADTTPARAPEDAPALVKKIGKTTYKVRVHFSDTSTETMSDKIKRMLKNEIQQM